MKKIIFILITIILFLLDWAALHDIITGNEPDYFAEYTVLSASLIFYICLAYYFSGKKLHTSAK